MKPMSMESLLTSRAAGFGLDASPMQIAAGRIKEGTPLGPLADVPEVRDMIGCEPSGLPTAAPFEVVSLGAVRCGKTIDDAANAIRLSQCVDVSAMKPGEDIPRITALSTSVDTSRAFYGHLVGTLRNSPTLSKLMMGEPTADSVVLRHPSGLGIEVKISAATRGGYSLASRWQAGVFFQEAPGWYSTDKIVSLEESRETALGRILPGGQIVYSGSPWQPSGFCFDAFTKSFGKPSADLIVLRSGPAWKVNPAYWTDERVAHIKRTSPRTYAMHLLAQFGSAQNSAFDYDDTLAMFGDVAPGFKSARMYGAIDASNLTNEGGDEFVAAIGSFMVPTGHREPVMHMVKGHPAYQERDEYGYPQFYPAPPRPVFRIHKIMSWSGRHPMVDVVAECAAEFQRWDVDGIVADQRDEASLRGLFSQHGLRKYRAYHWTAESKHAAVQTIRRLQVARDLSCVPHAKMRAQVLAYGYALTAGGGYKYQGRGAHDDHAAVVLTFAHLLNDGDALGLPKHDGRLRLDGSPTRGHRGERRVIHDHNETEWDA